MAPMMPTTTIMPNIFQRLPFVRAALRLKLFHGPICSTTHAGVATNHIMSSMMPGKTRSKQANRPEQQRRVTRR